jgi:spermidine synthase
MDEGSNSHYVEKQSESIQYVYRIEDIRYEGRTKFQQVEILNLDAFGLTLFLDGKIQSAEVDEFIYHEALVHPVMVTHPRPERVLILGGGEGATLREVLKHDSVKKAAMVDIDGDLVDLCKGHMPSWSMGAFDHPASELVIGDARAYVGQIKGKFDVIISDLTEPVPGGPSIKLFTRDFFQMISDSLSDEGLFVLQAGSVDPVWCDFYTNVHRTLQDVFPVVRGYQAFVLSFQMPWGFVAASRGPDPLSLEESDVNRALNDRGIPSLRFYHPSLHRSLFGLPKYLLERIQNGTVLTDEHPFVLDT